ncbi:MAG: serine/threonine-protein phosphatase [Flavobacterium sp.]|nr:serine/threonine-protein phosphatase [Flavobacterium sp.]
MEYFSYSNVGPRKINEDSLFVTENKGILYACIADGVGGMKHGKFASNFLTKRFTTNIINNPELDLIEFVKNANNDLIKIALEELNIESVGTTFTAGIISNNLIKGIHVGDSRVCVLRGNGIKQLTIEHNEAGRLMREGKINPLDKVNYPRKNIIESVIGNKELFEYQNFDFALQINDRIIFSTDGFHETLPKKEIRDISIRHKSLGEFFRQLVIEIESRILRDNTTFVCIEI